MKIESLTGISTVDERSPLPTASDTPNSSEAILGATETILETLPDSRAVVNNVNGCPFQVGDRIRVMQINVHHRELWGQEFTVAEVLGYDSIALDLGDRRYWIKGSQIEAVELAEPPAIGSRFTYDNPAKWMELVRIVEGHQAEFRRWDGVTVYGSLKILKPVPLPLEPEPTIDPIAEIEAALTGLGAVEPEAVLGDEVGDGEAIAAQKCHGYEAADGRCPECGDCLPVQPHDLLHCLNCGWDEPEWVVGDRLFYGPTANTGVVVKVQSKKNGDRWDAITVDFDEDNKKGVWIELNVAHKWLKKTFSASAHIRSEVAAIATEEKLVDQVEPVTTPKRGKKPRKSPKCPEFSWAFEDEPQPGDRVWYAAPTNQAIVQRVEGNTVHVVWEDDGELGSIPNPGNKARGFAEFWYGDRVWHEERSNTGMVQEVLDYGHALVQFDSGEAKDVSQRRLHPVYPSDEAKKQAKKPRKQKLFKAPNPVPVLEESEAAIAPTPKVTKRDLVASLEGVKARFDEKKAKAEVAESFIKWPGGKRRSRQSQIWQAIDAVWEKCSVQSTPQLIEPFCGAGNVALGLRAEKAILGDANPHIINLWQQVQASGLPMALEMANTRDCYEAVRDSFNEAIAQGSINTPEAAQQFLYLVKTGFNGLVRFNQSGGFNVPFGKHKNLHYPENLAPYQNISKHWQFICQDWRETLKLATADSFVYSDCPYDKFDGPEQMPLLGEEYRTEGSGFVSYTSGGFPWSEQVALARALAEMPCPVVVSNAATPRILELYRGLGFDVQVVQAKRSISCNGDRADAAEMIAVKLPAPVVEDASSPRTESDRAESLHDELAELEMKRDAIAREGGLAPQGAWLETGKVKGKEFRQAWWRSSKPMFTAARSKGNVEALVKSQYIGKEGSAEHKAAIASYQRRKEYDRLTRLIEKLEERI